MKKTISVRFDIEIFENPTFLTTNEEKCINSAILATNYAYAPYSKFYVGAALLLQNGDIITGSNQENAVFPLGLCAERVALFTFGNLKSNSSISAICIATKSNFEVNTPVFPCGSCRHVILEFEKRQNSDISILIVTSTKNIYKIKSVKDILPFAFDGDFLKI